DDRSLAALGRWPLSRRLFTKALQWLDQAEARVIGFDLLFAEAEQPIPEDVRGAARTAANGVADPQLRTALARLADDDPDDYFALPFSGDFVPSLAVRAAAAYLGLPWNEVGLALGDGVRLGENFIPTDPAMRFVVNYRGPRGTIPTYSFVDLVEGRIPAEKFKDRIVLIGASFIGIADSNPAPFDNTPVPGTERLASIVDTILAGDFIRENPPPWPELTVAIVMVLGLAMGLAAAMLPTRFAVLGGAVPILGWGVGAQLAFERGLWLPVVNPGI